VPDAGYVKCDFVLAMQYPHALIEPPRKKHVPVHFKHLLVVEPQLNVARLGARLGLDVFGKF
jgi:hypothetical protein